MKDYGVKTPDSKQIKLYYSFWVPNEAQAKVEIKTNIEINTSINLQNILFIKEPEPAPEPPQSCWKRLCCGGRK